MMYFGNRRPRGFHHNYIYVDERKELLRQLQQGKRPDAACQRGSGHPGMHGTRGTSWRPMRLALLLMLAVALAAACVFVMAFLKTL